MKIAIYHPWIYLKGGAERLILEYAKHSIHDITIFCSYFESQSTFPEFSGEIPVKILPGAANVKRDALNILKSYISISRSKIENPENFDLILISSEGVGDFLSIAASKKSKVPIFAYCHTPLKIIYDRKTKNRLRDFLSKKQIFLYTILAPAYRVLNLIIWRRYSHVFCNSRETMNRILNAKLCRQQNLSVVNPGGFNRERTLLKKTLPKTDEINLIIIGRIMWQKNIEIGIEAFARIRTEFPRAKLSIAGFLDKKSARYFAKLTALAKKLELENSIDFVINPNDSDLSELYRRAHVLIFTPENEDWGIVPLEAMSYGVPVVANNSGGPAESVIDGETGILVNQYTADCFSEALFKILDPERFNIMSERCCEHSKKYSWESFVENMDSRIEALLPKQ